MSTIPHIEYQPPRQNRLDIEVLSLSTLFSRADREHFRPPQRPSFHLLMYVTRGCGHHMVDFTQHECEPGAVVHVRPGQIQQYLRDTEFEAVVVLFTPLALLPHHKLEKVTGRKLTDQVVPSGHLVIPADIRSGVAGDFGRLEAEHRQARSNASAFASLLLQHQLHILLLRLAALTSQANVEQVSTATSQLVARFESLLEHQLGRHAQVGLFAQQLGCSRSALYAHCMSARGLSPKALIQKRLMLEAQRMLVHTGLPVEKIGAKLGFEEAANFARLFKRLVGVNPGRFRKDRGPA
jgi:AraC-like DNA-binding protein